MNTQEWRKAELSDGKEAEIPLAGQSVVLYLCPYDRTRLWESDIGSLYTESAEADAPIWESAFGIRSPFDGLKFADILKEYEVCFAEVPPLEYGRFPLPLGISEGAPKGPLRAQIRQILNRMK